MNMNNYITVFFLFISKARPTGLSATEVVIVTLIIWARAGEQKEMFLWDWKSIRDLFSSF